MHETLSNIDVSPLEPLGRIKAELDTLNGRLTAMDARRESVAAPVYTRVRADYEARRGALEAEAAPLKDAARSAYAVLREWLTASDAEHESTRLDREEVDFRYSLGEFDEPDYKKRLAAVDKRIAEKASAREDADGLRQRFLAVFESEDDLVPIAAAAASAPDAATVQWKTLASAETQRVPAVPPQPPAPPRATEPVTGTTARVQSADATQVMRTLKRGETEPAAPRSDQTLIMRTARLLPQNPEAGTQPIVIALKPLLFGSAKECDIRIAAALPKHAEIRASMAGFTLTAQGGGVRINGVVLEQHLLRQDDAIDVAGARYVFREA